MEAPSVDRPKNMCELTEALALAQAVITEFLADSGTGCESPRAATEIQRLQLANCKGNHGEESGQLKQKGFCELLASAQ